MAKLVKSIRCDYDTAVKKIHDGVMRASSSASFEDSYEWAEGGARCTVLVYERYSWMGSNRVSMCVTIMEAGGAVSVCGITSGGSQAVFMKVNTLGENSFLATLENVLDKL